ncbi:MAG: molybdenum cofactor guanylyltransferase MobA [Cycloclasticus sp.]|nr:molybdenum cofactor guanylyltransferase MobA [Cycloclasticus sp.]
MPDKSSDIIGVILAGGLSRRMNNQNKCFIPLNGKPLFEYVLEKLSPQCDTILINSNEQNERLAAYQFPIVKDSLEGFLGPLAGILSAMEWAKQHKPESKWILTVPVDTPFLPDDLLSKLYQSVQTTHSELACACSLGRTHPVIGLWPTSLADDLRLALTKEGMRKIDLWTSRYKISQQDFNNDNLDPFFNINCNEDLIEAESLLKTLNN